MLKMRPSDHRPEIVGLLDIGTSKICCLIVERGGPGDGNDNGEGSGVRLLGMGHQRAHGIKAGYVSDMDAAETAVRSVIGHAEASSGVTLQDIVVNVTCGRMKSAHFFAHTDLERGTVRDGDLKRLSHGAYSYAEKGGRSVVHMNRIGYQLDGRPGIRQPLRMAGNRLSAQYHAVTVDEPALQNVLLLVRRALLDVRQCVPAGLASALAVTTREERQHGVIVVDIGEGTMDIAVMAEDRFVGAEALPFGSGILTYDIAKALMTPLAEAERIKTLYGTMLSADSNDQQTFGYELSAGDDAAERGYATRSEVRRVIYPRMLGQLKLLRERFEANPVICDAEYSVVLTGEASLLIGLPAVAADVLGRPVRMGRPRLMPGLPDALRSPAFATAAGMVAAAARGYRAAGGSTDVAVAAGGGWPVIRDWLAQNF